MNKPQFSDVTALGFDDDSLLSHLQQRSFLVIEPLLIVPRSLVHHLQERQHLREILLGGRTLHPAPLLDHIEQLQHPVEVLGRHAPKGIIQRILLHRHRAAPQLSDESLVAHDERLGLGEAALAAGDDDDHADGAEEGEAGWAIHRD